jgi:hypothetical protein
VGLKKLCQPVQFLRVLEINGNKFQFSLYYGSVHVTGCASPFKSEINRINNICRTLVFKPYVISMLTAVFVWNLSSTPWIPLFKVPSPLASKRRRCSASRHRRWRTALLYLIFIAALRVPQNTTRRESWRRERVLIFKNLGPVILPRFGESVAAAGVGAKVFDAVLWLDVRRAGATRR